MYHHLNHNSNLNSSGASFPSERHLLLQAGNGPGDLGLILSTDAKPRLKWTPELHERFVEAVKQLGGERRLEAQCEYLQSVLEKAQETLEKQNLGSAGLETAKMQLSILLSKVSNECFTSAFPCIEKAHGSHNQQRNVARIVDCSLDSCLTSCQGSQKDQETHNKNVVLGAYHGNLSLGTQEMQESMRPEQIQSGCCEDLNGCRTFSQSRAKDLTHSTLPVSRGFSILSMSKSNQKDTSKGSRISEAHRRQSDEYNSYIDQAGYKRYDIQQKSLKNSSEFELHNRI